MTVLRSSRELLPYLILVCCGLLLTSVYFFHDSSLATWIQSSKINRAKQDTFINFQNVVKNNKGDPSYETRSKLTNSELNTSHLTSYSGNNDTNEDADQDEGNLVLENNVVWKTDVMETNSIDIDVNIQKLGIILETKLNAIDMKRIKRYKPTCDNKFKLANSCDNNKCMQTDLPENPTTRVEQLVTNPNLQMSTQDHGILREMADKVEGNYDIILLTAASSNHFLESQALLKNLHENVFPYLQNFTLIFYNLGLTEQERSLMIKYCQCQVMDFPFDKFPNFLTNLKCYSWKPVLIKSNLQKANIVFWMDASIRFHKSTNFLNSFIQGAREKGIQIGGSRADSPFRTFRNMYHFFGDEPCAYLHLGQAQATLGVYHREYFVDRVVLEPWVACALNKECMCFYDIPNAGCRDSKIMATKYYHGRGGIVYGLCHRFDQSAISIILHKLYQDYYQWVMVNTDNILSIQRKHTFNYFPEQ